MFGKGGAALQAHLHTNMNTRHQITQCPQVTARRSLRAEHAWHTLCLTQTHAHTHAHVHTRGHMHPHNQTHKVMRDSILSTYQRCELDRRAQLQLAYAPNQRRPANKIIPHPIVGSLVNVTGPEHRGHQSPNLYQRVALPPGLPQVSQTV